MYDWFDLQDKITLRPAQCITRLHTYLKDLKVQAPPLNCELVISSHLLVVQNMLSNERIEVLLSKFPRDNSSGPLLNSSSFHLSFLWLVIYISLLFYIFATN